MRKTEKRVATLPTPLGFPNKRGKYRLLTPEEEQELGRASIRGDLRARELLVCHNLPLVLWVVKKYADRSHFLEMSDLIQEGNLGLMRAAQGFNPAKGKFTTYAVLWIRQYIDRALDNQDRTVRIPVHVLGNYRAINVAAAEIACSSGITPSAQAIANRLKMSIGVVRETLEKMNSSAIVSLDAQLVDKHWNDLMSTRHDILPDEDAIDPITIIMAKQELEMTYVMIEKIFKIVRELSGEKQARNIAIFKELLGFNVEGEGKKLTQTCQEFDLNRSSIYALLNKVFNRLRTQSIEMDLEEIGDYPWRIQELEKITSTSREVRI